MGAELSSYHEAWLVFHPHRSREWLNDRLRDGFDVHHIDGNHRNNSPNNLVLIEQHDHMHVHQIHHFRHMLKKDRIEAARKGGANSRKHMPKKRATALAKKAARARWKPLGR